jgi:hypothetical protein
MRSYVRRRSFFHTVFNTFVENFSRLRRNFLDLTSELDVRLRFDAPLDPMLE